MLSSDKNVETIADLVEAVKHYLGLQAEYVKLDAIDKVVRVCTRALLFVLFFFIMLFVLLFASIALATWLSGFIGPTAAYLAVAGFYALLMVLAYIFRKPWIERPLVRMLARLLLNN